VDIETAISSSFCSEQISEFCWLYTKYEMVKN